MKNAFYSLIALCFISFQTQAQQKTLRIEGNQIKQGDLDFRGYFTQNIALENAENVEVHLVDIQETEVEKPMNTASIGNSFQPDVFQFKERKKEFLSLRIPAFKRAGSKITKLEQYSLVISYSEKRNPDVADRPTGVANSVLSSGTWYKIAVPKRGIFKIDYAFLQSMGINPSEVDPAKIRIYGNGGTVLSEVVTNNQPDDLIENAIFVSANGSQFQQNDYVLFYANGPVQWELNASKDEFLHTNNYYEDYSYYFFNYDKGAGKRIETESANAPASFPVSDFNDYRVIDIDSFNVGDIGKVWWSHPMNSINSASLTQNLAINLGGVTGEVKVNAQVGNINEANGNTLRLKINNAIVHNFTLNKEYTNYINTAYAIATFTPSSAMLNIQLQYLPVGNGTAYLDFLEFNYNRPLSFSSGQMPFRNLATLSLNQGELAGYSLQNANGSLKVWDITEPLNPIALSGNLSGNTYSFSREGHTLKEFIAFDGSSFSTPISIGTVANQNLHASGETDYLIITNHELLPAAESLAAFHREKYNTKVTIAEVSKIYNEFSSGGQDIAGIRSFIKMFYDNAPTDDTRIKNVLLMGAASYDYKDRLSNNTNIVPTFQTMESAYEIISYSSDDFFALLDENESMESGFLDVGIGRIPAYNVDEAQLAVDKIKRYASPESFGPWKNNVSFIADDKEGGIGGMNHLEDCETAGTYFKTDGERYNVYKIYEDAYPAIAGSGGVRYPAVNKAINDRIYLGTFLMSYSGHGSPTRWSHEAILTAADYNSWENKNKLPVIITATCDFGRFDDPGLRSAGVQLMLSPNSGAIALITTTQAVYATANTTLTRNFIQQQFTPESNGQYKSLGMALMKAKNLSGGGHNDHKFTVLGDPALKLQIPENLVRTDSILEEKNGSITSSDTLKSLGKYILKGSVTNKNNVVLEDFNGTVYITIFDKKTAVQTINPWPYTTPTFNLQTNIISRIRANVRNGQFSAPFLVPKDINYDFGAGKISYYANDETRDANGVDAGLIVGGFNPDAEPDNIAPIVEPFIDNDKFRDGGVTGPNPLLYVKLSDFNGINVSGNSPGHDLVAILDEDIQNPMVMNDYYQTEENNYRKGYVYFPLYNLANGEHTIRVKAWDAYNNSGEGTVRFIVQNPEQGFISELYNYPNPVTDITHFRFQHNQKGVKMDVTLQIFSTTGALMRNIQKSITPEGNSTEITWDGKGSDGNIMAKGVYPYRLVIKTEKGITATAYQKLVLLR